MPLPIAVLLSGSGSNLQSIIDTIERGVLDAEIKLVLSNTANAFGLQRAEKHGIPTALVEHEQYPSREAFDTQVVKAIQKAGANTVILAGFMRIITRVFLSAFPNRVLNIHPALLPSFAGAHGQSDAASYGVKISGCTVHFVDEKMDHGPIIIQAAVPAYCGESADALGKRILHMEHRIFPQAIQWLAQDRLRIQGRFVKLQAATQGLAPLPENVLVNPGLEQGF